MKTCILTLSFLLLSVSTFASDIFMKVDDIIGPQDLDSSFYGLPEGISIEDGWIRIIGFQYDLDLNLESTNELEVIIAKNSDHTSPELKLKFLKKEQIGQITLFSRSGLDVNDFRTEPQHEIVHLLSTTIDLIKTTSFDSANSSIGATVESLTPFGTVALNRLSQSGPDSFDIMIIRCQKIVWEIPVQLESNDIVIERTGWDFSLKQEIVDTTSILNFKVFE